MGRTRTQKTKDIPKEKATKNLEPGAGDGKILDETKAEKNKSSKFTVQPTAQWYTLLTPLGPSAVPTADTVASLLSSAASLHAADSKISSSSSLTSSTADESFLHKILQSGTLSDRLSALTLLIQSSPVHNIKALETLKSMAERGKGKGGRDESLKALRCIVDWWVGGGAPDRKLRYFGEQPLLHASVTNQHLVLWYFEDWLKKYFFSVLQIIETLSLDTLPYVRTQTLSFIFTLLRDKAEQEQNLLRLLVNKLGDTEKSVCSRASYHLLGLLQAHPSMKAVIVREITALVLRPAPLPAPAATAAKHIRFNDVSNSAPKPKREPKRAGNAHARYYASITLNQIVLAPNDKGVAVQLVDTYFEIFRELLGEGDESMDTVETAEPDEAQNKEGHRKGKEGKRKPKSKEIRGEAGFAEVESAQSRLISAILTGVNRALPFAKMDASDPRLNKHLDTLFLITHTSTFNTSLQALVLVQQICASLTASSAAPIADRYFRTLYTSLHDPRLATSSKQAMYLNLLFKSLKTDTKPERVVAFVRRFIQVLVAGAGGATEFVAGGLYLLGELFSVIPGLRDTVRTAKGDENGEKYDPRKRDPQYAHAQAWPLWELTPLVHHYHPTIALHASQLLAGTPLTASADLALNTLGHFLDRFVYRNAKKPRTRGASAMQPGAGESGASVGVRLVKGAGEEDAVNDEKWWGRVKERDVPADQVFFHRYFKKKSESEKAKAKKVRKRDEKSDASDGEASEIDEGGEDSGDGEGGESEDEAVDADREDEETSDLEEDEVWKAMKATMPKTADDEDLMEDSDDLPSGGFDSDEPDMSSDEEAGEIGEQSEDDLSFAEGSDNEDLLDLDDEVPMQLMDYPGSEADASDAEEEWSGFSDKKKRKREGDEKKSKRKKLRSLPTFASYDEYAKMIEDAPEDDV